MEYSKLLAGDTVKFNSTNPMSTEYPQILIHIGADGRLKNAASLTGKEITFLVVEDARTEVVPKDEVKKPGFGALRYATDFITDHPMKWFEDEVWSH